ncbi:hypothetical protein CHGG_02511 [Chaetomium globosum CBS 148.51]|uniref:Uncharacterized protein n=1 Tax=Chaetomium globosum (strain ATCC 6205 / CBS 148.51 / DSM 1962 / NBRC 6347 / NRRL 1970) TaxID=306901 RepID=Q2HB93_CHAGB|nr:uncharacterized protein CHGG_02511 [Chaetomium globosum CBS 148.51]EAQ90576.1 hypothetical protein CHGG_02511 [Chaetomium globosum CBS 148.51]
MDFLQRLARFLDRPLFPWKKLIIGFSVGQYVFEALLGYRQYKILQKTKPPKVLEHEVSQEVFDKSQAYGRAKAKFTGFNGLYGQLQNLAFYHFDVLPKLWSWTGDLLLRFAPKGFTGEISHSIVFILSFILINQVLSLPSNIYNTFVLEEKFGFNKQTPKLFVVDMIKTNLLAFVLTPPILSGFLAIIQKTGSQRTSFTSSLSCSVFVNNNSLYSDFGFTNQHPIIVGFLLFSDILGPLDNVIKLLMNILSRKFEFEADGFCQRPRVQHRASSLAMIKLQIQNLSTMDADWMFASYHFSHPILSERLKALNWQPTEKVEVKGGDKEAAKEDVATATGRDEL